MVLNHSSKTALFAGSFNPFTLGHLRIVERALTIADRVVVAVGYNINKGVPQDLDSRIDQIRRSVAPLNKPSEAERVQVAGYSGLTADFARKIGADFLVRGIRGVADFEYERNLADVNLKVLGIDTVLLCSEPEHGYISSSVVRELAANGFDVSSLLPN
ncbi:MAG: pantetheine-phosphate adenylyltransferase [Muribaculaceae bacterium]|nr:pantetheine-phosphate adenylyltransferase [Muribaculaceae bacterium]MDE6027204.1 pantetheine-phosphate adenylyltransferase [Muribaculaceae bacterium]